MRSLYERMLLIRRMEEQIGEDFHAGKLPGGVHLYIGQEAVAAGVCAHLEDTDRIASTHRGHGHFLAKGGDPRSMMAEIYGRRTGICKGLGGSMHVADFSKGILGANGIVGGGIAITVGAAFAAQLDGEGRVAVAFFGDGAANQGVLMEALNISALWKLPIVFVCENNGYSEFSPSDTVTAGSIADRARPFGMPITALDGNDVLEVWAAAAAAVDRGRQGLGPSFIEAKTYRLRGHLEAESLFLNQAYRTQEEIAEWQARDPLDRLADHMRSSGSCGDDDFKDIESDVAKTVAEAVRFAEESGLPDPDQVFDMMGVRRPEVAV